MNTKLSGAQLVLVPIERVGRNYFPYVENLQRRVIKYIDFCPAAYLPETTATGLTSNTDMFVTIYNEFGNTEIHRNLPLVRLDYQATNGIRQPIFNKISLKTSFIDCQDANQVGKVAALLFWYDLPEYSQRNMADAVVTDSLSIPLTTAVRYNRFPDNERMSGKRFRKILLGTPTTTPDLETCVASANLANIYMTLRKGSYNIVENLPIMLLYQLQMLHKSEFQNIIFDFQSSFLTIGGAGTIPNVATDYIGKNVFINLQYEAK